MTNSYQFDPIGFNSIRRPDLYSDRDITFGRETPTQNQFFGSWVPGKEGKVYEWTFVLNSVDGGLGRVRGNLGALVNRTRGEISGAPLETRYVDSLGLPIIQRRSTTPALSNTTPTSPSFRADASNSGTGTTATGNRPTGTADGDTLIAYVIHDDASTSVSAVPTGWSLEQFASPGATGDMEVSMYKKTAASEGASWNWTLSASERWRVYVVAVENGDGISASDYVYSRNATRFYLPSSGAAAISPSFDAGWESTGSAQRLASTTSPQGTQMTSVGVVGDHSDADQDILYRQYVVSTPLAAQTISAQTVKIQALGSELNSNNNQFLAWSIKVVTSAGALRGQVVALKRDGTEFNVGTQNRGDSTTTTQVITQDGDYLVFEIGIGGDPNDGTGDHDAVFYIGDSAATDLPENDTATTELNPWIEFANSISFSGSSGSAAVSAAVSRIGSLVHSFVVVDENSRTFTGATSSGGSLTENEDSAANSISAASYSESVSSISTVTHTLTRSAGTTDIAAFIAVIPPEAAGKRISHVNLFGYHAIAVGDSDLIRESSDLTPSLQTIGYSPPSIVNAIVPLIIGGATSSQRLAVLMTDDPITLLDDLSTTPTVNGTTLHANTEPAWGLIQTVLPEGDILIYANGNIYALSRTGAIGAAPTSMTPNVPNGGGAVGELWVPGQPIREFFMIPDEDTGRDQAETRNVPMHPVSFNAFGEDPQDLQIPFWATKNGVGRSYTTAAIWEQGMVLTDGPRIIHYTGKSDIMNWPGERPGVGELGQLLCRGFCVKAHQLRILVERVALYGGSGNSLYWIEEYDSNTHVFHQVSPIVDAASVGSILGVYAVGSLPVSALSEIAYWHDDTNWVAQLFTDLVRNPVYDINGITGAGLQYGFEQEATWTSPEYLFPFGKRPSVVTEIETQADIEKGGDDATMIVKIADQSRTSLSFPSGETGVYAKFKATDKWEAHHKPFPRNLSQFDRLQVQITGTRGSEANKTPQLFPVTIKGLTFFDGKAEEPRSVLGEGWLQRFQ